MNCFSIFMGLKITDVKNITRQNCSNVEMLFCSWWIAPACYSIETIDTEMCGFEQKKKKKNHDGNVQMGRRGGMGLYECVSVGGGGRYPEAQIVIDWPGRTVMQIHSSRLMFCHSALSAIKLAPVLKSPADNVAEAEITLHFPCAFLHLHPCHSHSEIYFTLSASIGRGTFPASWPARHPWFTTLCSAPGFFFFCFFFFFHVAHKVVFKSMPPKSF